ncbi:MAG: conjugation TrbI family protein, partial [Phenylobacterium sp.]|nr:conjugation TrbI family protein [Phenylobacterium sp.]
APPRPPPAAVGSAAAPAPRPASATANASLKGPAQAAAPATPSPILVVDSSAPPPAVVAAPAGPRQAASDGPAKPGGAVSPDEQFAARVGEEAPPTSHAHRLDHPDQVIAQGAMIPAVLETALNSDLPGYARALVSRDVRSFDGSQVLIPRGSRLVGQYKSALETGQTRMLIVWTRLLRPDGLTLQLGSPSTDDLGQAGLSGKVDRHLLQRYGSAVLLSVVGSLASVGGSSNTVVIGATGQGASAAGIALQNDGKISPTIRVAPGAPIQVFVARDLDFAEDAP